MISHFILSRNTTNPTPVTHDGVPTQKESQLMRQTYQRCETEQPFILPAYTLRCIQQKSLLIGGGGENRTRVLKSPHRGFIFNQNPAPPLYLKSRFTIKKVTFKNLNFKKNHV